MSNEETNHCFEEQQQFKITTQEQLFKRKCLRQTEVNKKPSIFERFTDIEEIVRNNIRLQKEKNKNLVLRQTARDSLSDRGNIFSRQALKILKLPLKDEKLFSRYEGNQINRINQTNLSFYHSHKTNHSTSNGLVKSEFTTPIGTSQLTTRSSSLKNQNSNMIITTNRSNFLDSHQQNYINHIHIRSLNNSISHRSVSSVGQNVNNQEINMRKSQQRDLQFQSEILSSLDRQNSSKTLKNSSQNSPENKPSFQYQQTTSSAKSELTSLKSTLISEIDADKIILLRNGGYSKSIHLNNFYLQMISNEKVTSPEYPCCLNELISKEEECIDGQGQQHQRQQEFKRNKTLEKKCQPREEFMKMEDGSILKIQKVRSASESISQQKRLELHNSQNMNFKKSNKRKDIMLLSEWLDKMVKEVYESCQNIKQFSVFYGKLERVFDGAIRELARQIQLDCSERAQFLIKVWSLYCSLVEEVIQRSQETNLKIEKVNKEKLNSLHSNYLCDLADAEMNLKVAEEKLEMNENYMNKLRSENRYLRKKWRKLEQSNEMIKQDFEQILAEREELVKENQVKKGDESIEFQ